MTCTQGDAINSLVFDCVYAIICSMNIIIDTDVWVEHSYARRLRAFSPRLLQSHFRKMLYDTQPMAE
jgi:hypothetical protein